MPAKDDQFFVLKAAARDLIRACGGVERAGAVSSHSKSTVSRWGSAADPDMMPLTAALALERDCGEPLITAAMAQLHGRALAPPEDAGEAAARVQAQIQSGVAARFADATRSAAELMSQGVSAIADGRVTPAEADALRRSSGQLASLLAELNRALATVQACGGAGADQGFGVIKGGR